MIGPRIIVEKLISQEGYTRIDSVLEGGGWLESTDETTGALTLVRIDKSPDPGDETYHVTRVCIKDPQPITDEDELIIMNEFGDQFDSESIRNLDVPSQIALLMDADPDYHREVERMTKEEVVSYLKGKGWTELEPYDPFDL